MEMINYSLHIRAIILEVPKMNGDDKLHYLMKGLHVGS
ncbi:unnamed protein product [Spirodela intermedia]|uniref:Uncharacterized protein n=1 Tax=Spirodela intermedia TaxID=51605 RepID=A0A7I8IIC6_SPIIN|nr:unnamed protein product [Spirodela intermedia]CAA6657602.1 unnamed protein product [Spirodela intermedia]